MVLYLFITPTFWTWQRPEQDSMGYVDHMSLVAVQNVQRVTHMLKKMMVCRRGGHMGRETYSSSRPKSP